MAERLTIKQETFCQKYVECGNGFEAYRKSSYRSENMKDISVRSAVAELLKNPSIQARIAELEELRLERHKVTIDRVVAEYAKIGFSDHSKAFNPDGSLKPITEMDKDTIACLAGFEVEEGKDGAKLKKVRLIDRKGALDSLMKYLGVPEKLEVGGKNGGPIVTTSVTADDLKSLLTDGEAEVLEQLLLRAAAKKAEQPAEERVDGE